MALSLSLCLCMFPCYYNGLIECGAIEGMWVTPSVPVVAMVGGDSKLYLLNPLLAHVPMETLRINREEEDAEVGRSSAEPWYCPLPPHLHWA